MSSEDMAADPQYQAREMHIEWEDGQAEPHRRVVDLQKSAGLVHDCDGALNADIDPGM